ncbi:Protein SRI-62 [Aphelenchoides avenae]|nr:Protein SRI-62 [Aphelenchus avenae]
MFVEIHDYKDERVSQLCDWIIDVSFALSTILAPMMIYLVLKESKDMGKYRWYLLNEVFWCYLYDVALTVWKPVFLGPLLAGYSQSSIRFSRLGSWLTFAAATIFTVNSGLALVMACFYRFAQAYPGAFREFFEKKVVFIYVVVHLVCYAYFLGPTPFAQMWNDDDVRAYLSAYPQQVAELASLNGLWIYRRTTLTELFCLSIAICYSLFVVTPIVCLSRLYLHAQVWRLMPQNKSTYRMQIMLLKALIIQVGVAGAFIIFPMVTIGLTLYTASLKGGPVVTIMIAMTSMHASFDFAILIYFISPYRRASLKLLRKLFPLWTKADSSEQRNSGAAVSVVSTRVQRPLSAIPRR